MAPGIPPRALLAVGLAVAALSVAACGSSAQYLAARPLPVVVTPANGEWNVGMHLSLADRIRLRLVNASPDPVTVVWDECAYIDVNQQSHQVIPASARPVGGSLRSTVAPGTKLDEVLTVVKGVSDSPLDPLVPARATRSWWWPFGGSEPPPRIGARIARDHPLLGREVGLFLVLRRGTEQKTVFAKYELAEEPTPSVRISGSEATWSAEDAR